MEMTRLLRGWYGCSMVSRFRRAIAAVTHLADFCVMTRNS